MHKAADAEKISNVTPPEMVVLVVNADGVRVKGPSLRRGSDFGKVVPSPKVPRGIEAEVSAPVRDILFGRAPISAKKNPAILNEIGHELENNVLKKVYASKGRNKLAAKTRKSNTVIREAP